MAGGAIQFFLAEPGQWVPGVIMGGLGLGLLITSMFMSTSDAIIDLIDDKTEYFKEYKDSKKFVGKHWDEDGSRS